jgi:MtN3 and saliva related transmembrane protein
MDFTTLVGLVAAFCTTVSYYPQLKKCWTTGSAGDLSLTTFLTLSGGVGLWVVYGFLKSDLVIITANAVSFALLMGIRRMAPACTAGTWYSEQGIKLLISGWNGDALFQSATDVQTIVDPAAGHMAENRGRDSPTRAQTAQGLRSAMSLGVSCRSPFHRPGLTCGFVRLRTDIFRPLGGTARDASNIATTRAFVKFARYEHVVAFAEALPTIRAKVREHMALRGLPREKVLATVVHLLSDRHDGGDWI